MSFPRFADVRGIADDLGDEPSYRRLSTAIRKSAVAQSCMSDLEQASTCCAALDQLLKSPRKKGTLERSATEQSLLAQATLFYVRATSTSSGRGERGAIQIRSKLSARQIDDHKALLAVRNRALAHVYTDAIVGDDYWHRDKLFIVETPHGWRPASATKRVQFSEKTFERLKSQLPIAKKLVEEIFHRHIDELTRIMAENPVEEEVFEKNLFDPVEFFGSERGVRVALAGMEKGSAAGLA